MVCCNGELPREWPIRLPVAHHGQLYSRLNFTLYYVLWRASQEELHTPVEIALYTGIVVDPRMDSHRGALNRTSLTVWS